MTQWKQSHPLFSADQSPVLPTLDLPNTLGEVKQNYFAMTPSFMPSWPDVEF